MPRTLRPSGWVLGLTTVALVAAAGTVGVSLVVRDAQAEPAAPSGETPYWEQGQAGRPAPRSGVFKVAAQPRPAAPAAPSPAPVAPAPQQIATQPAAVLAPAAPAAPAPAEVQLAQAGPGANGLQVAAAAKAIPPNDPMAPVIELNREAYQVINGVRDYTCVFIKREKVKAGGWSGGYKLSDNTHIYMKLRQEPFSVYMKFLKPTDVAGREVIYVEGKNDNKLLAHSTGLQALAGTVSLDPLGPYAMEGNAYPITAAGLKNLVSRMLPNAEDDVGKGETEVQFFKGAKVDDRPCTCVQVAHPIRRKHFLYYISRAYYDEENKLPVRTELYDWPQTAGGQPELVGEYTYTKLKFNVGLTDHDFDTKNKEYGF